MEFPIKGGIVMKKQNILKAGLFAALALQISWNTHQAHKNDNISGQANFASISKSNTAAHHNNDSVLLQDQIKNADSLEVRIGKETYHIDIEVQEGINNLCASEPTNSSSIMSQLSTSTTQRSDINCGSTVLSEYIENNKDNSDRLKKDVFKKVQLTNLPKDLAEKLNQRINTEANCNNCEIQTVTTRVYDKSAGIDSITDLRNSLAAVLNSAAKETEKDRAEREKNFKKFKRIAKRMQQCEISTPDGLEDILGYTDLNDLKYGDIDYSIVEETMASVEDKEVKKLNSKSEMTCKKDRYTNLADNGYLEEAEKYFFEHMQSDLLEFIRANPRDGQSLINELASVAGLGLDEWDAHFGMESSYAALQILNTELMFREKLIDYADVLRNPNLSAHSKQIAFKGLHDLRKNYDSRIKLINSYEDKDATYYNDLTVLGGDLSDNIGFNLTALYCDAGTQNYVLADYRCNYTVDTKASDVYESLAGLKYRGGVTTDFPMEHLDIIAGLRADLVPQKYEKYISTSEGFRPSIVTDRYDINDLSYRSNSRNKLSTSRLSDSQLIRNRSRNVPSNRRDML